MTFRMAYVVDTHPEDHSVDLVMADDGSRLTGIQLMSQSASTRTGKIDMPSVPKKANKWDITKQTGQDQLAIVGYVGSNPVVMGYLFPQVSQMTFKDGDRKFERHQSDVYSTIDGKGNYEWHHPSGAYVRFAEDPSHEDLEKKNFDENLKLDRNKDRKVHARVKIGDTYIDIAPEGTITVNAGGISFNHAGGAVSFKAGSINIDCPMITTNGDIQTAKVKLNSHEHTGVKAGGEVSGPPVGTGNLAGKSAAVSSGGSGTGGAVSSSDMTGTPTITTGPDGERKVTYPSGAVVSTDAYGNTIYASGVGGADGPLYYVQKQRQVGDTYVPDGEKIYVTAGGEVIESLTYQPTDLVLGSDGQLHHADPVTITQTVPDGDPAPGNAAKIAWTA